jgi:hypothetical protein
MLDTCHLWDLKLGYQLEASLENGNFGPFFNSGNLG